VAAFFPAGGIYPDGFFKAAFCCTVSGAASTGAVGSGGRIGGGDGTGVAVGAAVA
jgi:hypothetical protein